MLRPGRHCLPARNLSTAVPPPVKLLPWIESHRSGARGVKRERLIGIKVELTWMEARAWWRRWKQKRDARRDMKQPRPPKR